MLSDTPVEHLEYEEALQELDQLTKLVEHGQLPIQDAIMVYERGQALLGRAQARLDQFLRVLQQNKA